MLSTLAALMFTLVSTVTCATFSYPPQGRITFEIGDVKTIKYKSDWDEYTIALWQQHATGGGATLGPIVYQSSKNGKENTQFDWLVQLYDFSLKDNNVFFFWMKEGGPNNQGQGSASGWTSAYFKIAKKPKEETTSSVPTSLTTSATVPESTVTATIGDDQSTTTSVASEPTSDSGSDQTDGAGDTQSDSDSGGNYLSEEAKIGMGVGLGIGGACLAIITFFLARYLRSKQRAVDASLTGNSSSSKSIFSWISGTTAKGMTQDVPQEPLLEMDAYYTGPAEMPTQNLRGKEITSGRYELPGP